MRTVSKARIWTARAIAVCADLVQIVLLPLFSEGIFSPFEDALDLVVCVAMTLLVGWHIAFVPSFVVKLVPFVDLAPTWTIAVLIATRKSQVAPPEPTMKTAVVIEDKKVA